jgi:hypothetical protein
MIQPLDRRHCGPSEEHAGELRWEPDRVVRNEENERELVARRRDGARGTLSRAGTELRVCSMTRRWARRAAKVRSFVRRVVAGMTFQSGRTREDVRSEQQDCGKNCETSSVAVRTTLTNERSMALRLSACGVYRLWRCTASTI